MMAARTEAKAAGSRRGLGSNSRKQRRRATGGFATVLQSKAASAQASISSPRWHFCRANGENGRWCSCHVFYDSVWRGSPTSQTRRRSFAILNDRLKRMSRVLLQQWRSSRLASFVSISDNKNCVHWTWSQLNLLKTAAKSQGSSELLNTGCLCAVNMRPLIHGLILGSTSLKIKKKGIIFIYHQVASLGSRWNKLTRGRDLETAVCSITFRSLGLLIAAGNQQVIQFAAEESWLHQSSSGQRRGGGLCQRKNKPEALRSEDVKCGN